jgi:pyruvate,orthophosphate dikinase
MSMPGMMDTVLNIGLNDEVVVGLAKLTGNERFAYDSYRRLINMFGDTVMGVDHEHFEHELSAVKSAKGVKARHRTGHRRLKEVVERYKKVYKKHVGSRFPAGSVSLQLEHAIEAVFKSWMGDRAIRYRQLNDIRGLRGTAVNVQSMVFGNMGDDSATGVAFTRNPSTGENKFYGEFLVNAQGEDVVAGIRTPLECASEMGKWSKKSWKELLAVKRLLEARYKDVQDFEFTIEKGKLYMLQTRNGKRTTAAAVKIAVDMVKEKLIDEKTAVLRVDPASLDQLLHPTFDPKATKNVIAKGLPASPGAAVGKLAFTAEEAEQRVANGEKDHPRPPRNRTGRHRRHARLRRHSHQHRRHDQPRGRGRPRHGHALRRRRRRVHIDAKNKTSPSTARPTASTIGLSLDGGIGEVYEGKSRNAGSQLSGAFRPDHEAGPTSIAR